MEQLGFEHHQLICSILYFAMMRNNIKVNDELQFIMNNILDILAPYKQTVNTSQQAM